MMRGFLAVIVTAALANVATAQQCGGNRSVDFGNANLGQQLNAGGGASFSSNNDAALEALRAEVARLAVQTGRQQTYDDGNVYMTYAPKEKLVNGQFQNVAMKRQAASSASAASSLTQPGGYLTFQEGAVGRLEEVPPLPGNANCGEVASLKAEMRAMMAELDALRSERRSSTGQIMYLTGAQQVATGGASAAASASTAAPSVAQLALTAPAPSRSANQSACSSGGCGGGGRFRLFNGGSRRQVSRSRAVSVTSTN